MEMIEKLAFKLSRFRRYSLPNMLHRTMKNRLLATILKIRKIKFLKKFLSLHPQDVKAARKRFFGQAA